MNKILLFFCVLQSLTTFAQSAADVDLNFGPGAGYGGLVEHIVTQPDGKIIMKGTTAYMNTRTKGLIRVNPDGSLDPTFDYNLEINDITIKSIVLQPDGKVVLGGMDYYDNTLVVRLNADGSKDTNFQYGAVPDKFAFVNAIALQSDGKILVANTRKSTDPKKRLIRLNTDGSLDTTFDIGTGFDDDLSAIIVQDDGKILVGGEFSKFKGVTQKAIIRLNVDGTKDNSFNTGTGLEGYVFSIVLQNDGKIIAGGRFSSYQGVAQKYLIRLNTDGSKDTSFTNPTDFAIMDFLEVNKMCLQPDGKLIVNFYESDGDSYGDDSVYRFNSDGSFDSTFPYTTFSDGANLLTGNMNADVFAITLMNDGRILIGGEFNFCRKILDRGLVCLNKDGSRDTSFKKITGLDAYVKCSAIQTDGKTLIGGYFDNFHGVTQKKMIRLNLDGSKDASFNPESQFNDEVQSILLQADGKILVRGKFTDFGNYNRNSLVRLNIDGSRDVSFLRSSEYAVEAIALQPDGKILVSGFVDSYPNLPYRKLFRLKTDGTPDISFKAGVQSDFNNKGISSIVVQPDGKILVGGTFTTFNKITQNHLVRLNPDGSKDTTFDFGTLLYDLAIYVKNITLQPDGKILVSGIFSPTTGDYKVFLIRLNSDGSKDSSFSEGVAFNSVRTGSSAEISSLVLQTDGKILVGGDFDTFQGIPQRNFTRLNSDGSVDTSFGGNGFGSSINSISLFPDGKINVGGWFTSYQNAISSYLVRLKGTYVKPSVNATTIQTNATCPGSSSGSASIVSVYDGKGPYTYLWSNGETTAKITGLPAGNYSCKITDSELSSITKNFIISTDSDVQNPTITAPAAVVVNVIAGCTATEVVLGTPVTSDNCTVASVTNNAPSTFPVGITTVTWTVKDANNNVAIALQTITVKDVTLPTITAPKAITVNTNAGCTATGVTLGTPVTADNCSVVSVTSNAPKSFPLGNTIVTWTVKDKSNNIATATQLVTVKDVTPPTITAPAAVIVNPTFNCKATGITLGTPRTADNCSVSSVRNDAPASFPLGNTTVTWTVKDGSNNTATATQIVTVKGPDVTLSYNEGKLSVAETGATYKWLTCNNGIFTAISNENMAVFIPKVIGSYAVEVTKNGCTATSTCFDMSVLGTKDFDLQNSFKLYPNPAKDFVTIEMNTINDAKLDVFDVRGNVLISKELKTTSTKLNLSNLPVGIYFFRISNDMGTVTKKVIKD